MDAEQATRRRKARPMWDLLEVLASPWAAEDPDPWADSFNRTPLGCVGIFPGACLSELTALKILTSHLLVLGEIVSLGGKRNNNV
jgi:hypothetical protein